MAEDPKELRKLLDQAHEVMQIQLVGLARLKRERNLADGLIKWSMKEILPLIGDAEGPKLLSVYGAMEDHCKLVESRKKG